MSTGEPRAKVPVGAAALIDAATLVVFVVAGRASHHHGEDLAGIASTIWPFAVGMSVTWTLLVRRTGHAPAPGSISGGMLVTVGTVAIGMALRVVAGQGTAASFVGVATGFFGVTTVGGRLLLRSSLRRLSRPRPG